LDIRDQGEHKDIVFLNVIVQKEGGDRGWAGVGFFRRMMRHIDRVNVLGTAMTSLVKCQVCTKVAPMGRVAGMALRWGLRRIERGRMALVGYGFYAAQGAAKGIYRLSHGQGMIAM